MKRLAKVRLSAAGLRRSSPGEEAPHDYTQRMHNLLYQPDSAYKRLINFYAEYQLAFNDWYYLRVLGHNYEATCESVMPLEDFATTCKQYKESGVISAEQLSAMEKLIDNFKMKGQN